MTIANNKPDKKTTNNIVTAELISMLTSIEELPATGYPEYAFAGRSNVGKSSLINMLTGRNKLARTSSTPGKTQTINHYLINNEWYLVDLPGYGYAKISKTARQKWFDFINKYLETRKVIASVFVLVDINIPVQKIDIEFINFLGEQELPVMILFTKSDRLKRNLLNKNIAAYKKHLTQFWEALPPMILTSSETKTGRDEILEYILNTNMVFQEYKGKI